MRADAGFQALSSLIRSPAAGLLVQPQPQPQGFRGDAGFLHRACGVDLEPQDRPLTADRHGAVTSLNWKGASWQGVPLKERRQALLMSWVLEMQHSDAELRGNAVVQQCDAPR